MLRITIIICSLGIGLIAEAQILKVDKGSIDADSSHFFMGGVDFNFNINNRSTTSEEQITFRGLKAQADLVYVAHKHAFILINNLSYFTSTGGPLISTGYAHFRINFLRKNKLSYEMYSQIQYDDGRKMPFRFLQGGGIRYRLLKSGKSLLHLGIGAMYEIERWKSITVEDLIIEKGIMKTSSYLSGNVRFNENVGLKIVTYYQAGYDADEDIFRNRISGDIVLIVGLSNKLDFITNFTAQYEDKPIIPINNFVYSLTNGLKWNF